MYGANLKEYALDVLRNKQIARSTFVNWQGVIRNLPLENYQFPPNPTEIYNMVSEKYSNPRTKRAILILHLTHVEGSYLFLFIALWTLWIYALNSFG
jgi:hypothetical protein